MTTDTRKVVLIGTGMVGMSFAYALVNQGGICNELVLIDVNKDKANGEAMDLNHGLAFAKSNMQIKAGDYKDCRGADIVVIAAGVAQKEGETRLDLLQRNVEVFRSITTPVVKSGFDGIFLVVSNPVDVMSYYTWKVSGLPHERVIGSGTFLDSARLCRALSDMYDLASNSVEAYVLGEHGDSEIVSWNSATIGGKRVDDVLRDNASRTRGVTRDELRKRTVQAGWDIFSRKGNTCYGIASSTASIAKSILFDENRIMPVSVYLNGQYGIHDTFISVPTIVDSTGAKEIVEIDLLPDELEALRKSADMLHGLDEKL